MALGDLSSKGGRLPIHRAPPCRSLFPAMATEFGKRESRRKDDVGLATFGKSGIHDRPQSLFSSRSSTLARSSTQSALVHGSTGVVVGRHTSSHSLSHIPVRCSSLCDWPTSKQPSVTEKGHPIAAADEHFIGLAITKLEGSGTNGDDDARSAASRRQTEQRLAYYHRPTQINCTAIPVAIATPATRLLERATMQRTQGVPSCSRQVATPPFHGRVADWSPALLSPDCFATDLLASSSCSSRSSSTLTLASSAFSRPCTPDEDGKRQVWRVSSTGPSAPTTFAWP